MDPDPPLVEILFSFIFLQVQFSSSILLALILLVLLIFCSAMISGSEVAFFSLDPKDLNELKETQSKNSERIIDLKERPRTLLATILISNNFINIAIIILSEYILRNILPDNLYYNWGESIVSTLHISFMSAAWIGVILSYLITVVLVTFLLVLFGEVTPKLYANIHNLPFAKAMALPLSIMDKMFSPLSGLLVRWTNILENRLSNNNSGTTDKQELDKAISIAMHRNDENSDEEADILKGILKFGDVATKQIMKSRVDVVAIDEEMTFPELMGIVRKSGYSRLPVFKEDFDNIRGILYVKDLLGHLNEKDSFKWQTLIRENLLYVPESKKIDDLLKEFQTKRMHMAIVVDEYGGSAGLVTLEDVMEEVIGDIKDEFDDDREVDYVKLHDRSYIFEGKTLLNDVCRIMGLEIESFDDIKGESDSLAGLVLEIVGFFPKLNQEVKHNSYLFKIIATTKRRIERINITLNEDE